MKKLDAFIKQEQKSLEQLRLGQMRTEMQFKFYFDLIKLIGGKDIAKLRKLWRVAFTDITFRYRVIENLLVTSVVRINDDNKIIHWWSVQSPPNLSKSHVYWEQRRNARAFVKLAEKIVERLTGEITCKVQDIYILIQSIESMKAE